MSGSPSTGVGVFLELPLTDVKGSDVFGVVNYYLKRPPERRKLKSGW